MKFTKFISIALALLFAGTLAGCNASPTAPPEAPPAAPVTTPAEPEKAKVILLAGEGNCVGNTYSYFLTDKQSRRVSEEKYAEYKKGYENVLISYRNEVRPGAMNGESNGFVPVRLGQGRLMTTSREDGTFGPEIGLAESFSVEDETTYIVKFGGDGSSRLVVEWRPDGGGYYEAMTAYFNAALRDLEEQGVSFEIPAFLFIQGESDTMTALADYDAALERFISAVRTEFSRYAPKSGIAFIDAGVNPYYVGSYELDTVKRARAADDERNYFLDAVAAGLTHENDSRNRLYWDALSELKLGNLLASLVRESCAYRLDCTTLSGERAETPDIPADGYKLEAYADGQAATSVWKFGYADTLTVETYVSDAYVTAGDGIELTLASRRRVKNLPRGTIKLFVSAEGKATYSVRSAADAYIETASAVGVEHLLYDGGYLLRVVLKKADLPAGTVSLSFALRNANETAHTVSYTALGTDPSRLHTYMTVSGTTLSAGYAQLGETFGDGGLLRAEDVWDLTGDDGSSDANIVMTGVYADNDLYFYRSCSPYLYAEAEIGALAVLNGERWGKFGLKVVTENDTGFFFYVDAWGDGANMYGLSLGYATFKNGAWTNDWQNFSATPLTNASQYTSGTVKFGIRRKRDVYELYFEDILIATLNDPAGIGTTKAYIGLASFNIVMRAHSYSLTEESV